MSTISLILTSIFIFGVPPLLIFYLTRFTTAMAKEASLPKYLTWLIPVLLTCWCLSAHLIGIFGNLAATGLGSPVTIFQLAIPMPIILLALFRSKPITRLLKTMPSEWLIGVQVYRSAGFLLLYLYFHDRFVTRDFALSAGIGDIFVGLSSMIVVRWVRAKAGGYLSAAVIWNIIGIVDLVTAPLAAILTKSGGISTYPLVVVPLFLGPPMGILMHVASLRNLYLRKSSSPSRDFAIATGA